MHKFLAALKSLVWNNMLEKDTELHLSLRLTEVAKACHLLLAFSLSLGLLLFLWLLALPLTIISVILFVLLLVIAKVFFSSHSHITLTSSEQWANLASVTSLSFVNRFGIRPSLSPRSYYSMSLLLDCFSFFLCASPRMDPHRLVSLPLVHPLLCLHLCNLHKRYSVITVLPQVSFCSLLCMC